MGSQLREALKSLGLAGVQADTAVKKSAQAKERTASPPRQNAARNSMKKDIPSTWGAVEKGNPQVKSQRSRIEAKIDASEANPIDRKSSGLPTGRAASSKPVPPVADPDFQLEKTGDFRPHPLFVKEICEQRDLIVPDLFGVSRQLAEVPQDETDLIIGLDFGTSATKMVIRDAYSGTVFPVEVNSSAHGVDRFLQASCVFYDEGAFALSGKGVRLDDLKLSLLACKSALPVTEFNHSCAYLALMIRKARGWLLTEHEAVYRNHKLNWHINVGIAARSYQDDAQVQLFRRLAWAAANLAADGRYPHITQDAVEHYRKVSQHAFGNKVPEETFAMEFAPSNVGVVPEVSAQIQGFMTSARWDWKNRPIMMLVDVGAGTVDTALFHVNPSDGKLTFYSSRVEPNGAMNLHRERVSWLIHGVPDAIDFLPVQEYLKSIAQPTGRLQPIPIDVADYLPGYRISKVSANVDEKFRLEKYRYQVAGSLNEAKVKKGIGAKGSQQLRDVPLLLCGGGSRLPIYSTIAAEINRTPGWNVSVEKTMMPVPSELKDTGWHLEDFDRISVAYGLSLQQSLEKIVRAIDVPDFARLVSTETADRYVSKDHI